MEEKKSSSQLETGMTLTQLRDRLTTLIAENEADGQSELNDTPMAVRVHRYGKNGRRLDSHYYPVRWAPRGRLLVDPAIVYTLDTREEYKTLT